VGERTHRPSPRPAGRAADGLSACVALTVKPERVSRRRRRRLRPQLAKRSAAARRPGQVTGGGSWQFRRRATYQLRVGSCVWVCVNIPSKVSRAVFRSVKWW